MDWKHIKNFIPSEWKKDPNKVHPKLVQILDNIREISKIPIIIHVAFDYGGHSTNSYHYKNPSLAVDWHFNTELTLSEQLEFILPHKDINGIGVYPEWAHKGFHTDLRKSPRLFWLNIDGKYRYYTDLSIFLNEVKRYE